jgi:ABC-type spermidine/putrescine transport system permease subunit II
MRPITCAFITITTAIVFGTIAAVALHKLTQCRKDVYNLAMERNARAQADAANVGGHP